MSQIGYVWLITKQNNKKTKKQKSQTDYIMGAKLIGGKTTRNHPPSTRLPALQTTKRKREKRREHRQENMHVQK